MVVHIRPDHSYAVVTRQREPVRLGENEFGDERLRPEAMDRAVLVCRSFADLARSYGASQVFAVATSATREASNRREFLERLRNEAGLQVHAISGQEEARLIYQGLLSRVDIRGRGAVVVDIGGGSTEIAIGEGRSPVYLSSTRIGALRLSAELPNDGGPLSAKALEELTRRIKLATVHVVREARQHPVEAAFGTAGTIKNLAAAAARHLHDTEPQRDQPLSRADLRRLLKLLRGLPVDKRGRVPGIEPGRADIIVAGAAILESLLTDLGIKEIVALADCGVREGLLRDYLERTGHEGLVSGMTVRERSVLQLARACRADEAHARQVQKLALELFDSSREAGWHDLDDERELLAHAAMLHDIGAFVSYRDHHVHSAYLTRNYDLLGFSQDEIDVIAAVVLFHRKAAPSARHPAVAEMGRQDREAVETLGLMLRMAEPLDRSRGRRVHSARLFEDGGGAVLELVTTGDCRLELWGIERGREQLKRALGRELTIRTREAATALT